MREFDGAAARLSIETGRFAFEHDLEGRAVARCAMNADIATHGVDRLAREPQAKPKPAVTARVRRAAEALEDELLLLSRQPHAMVAHARHRGRAFSCDGHLDRSARPE